MMKIAKLLAIHEAYSGLSRSCANVMGDGYLMYHNPVYRGFRISAWKAGFRTVHAWPSYVRTPIFELDRILLDRKIPYIDNVSPLKHIESRSPGVFRFRELPEIPSNYMMHESAHAVAEAALPEAGKSARLNLLRVLIGESLANTADAMAWHYADNASHRQLLCMNSYFFEAERDRNLRQRVIEKLGFPKAFVLTFWSYLYSNFLYESISTRELERVLDQLNLQSKPNQKLLRDCNRLFDMAFNLNLEFRTLTARFYLKSHGHSGDLFKLLKFDFHKILARDTKWNQVIEDLSHLGAKS